MTKYVYSCYLNIKLKRMKRMKVNQKAALLGPVYQTDRDNQGNHAKEDTTTENVGFRMLENLKMALLFSRFQHPLDNERLGL